ncbi:MAG: intradiol ring-cleavage dioxygenase [Chloroflexi bacterium]|nr:intradiol ring-cleavage dioxygenase [Chloroflexota bacterium]
MHRPGERRILSRRAASLAGVAATAGLAPVGSVVTALSLGRCWLAAQPEPAPTAARRLGATPLACVVTPALTEGPYFVDARLERSDLRTDTVTGVAVPGTPLEMELLVARVAGSSCTPLASAILDLWQCDAAGRYSGVSDPGGSTRGSTFLRGYQRTDEQGRVRFLTIFPGWYRGRAVHIHFKVRTDPTAGRGYEFTSQLFFDDALIDQIHAQPPYTARGQRDTRNAADSIFRRSRGQTVVPLVPSGNGYTGTLALGVQLS